MSTHTSRRVRVLTTAALAVAAVSLVGCSSGSKSTAGNTSAKSMQQSTVTASARPQSRDVTTAIKGKTFTVQLPTTSGSGYSWRLAPASADDKFVSLQELKQQQNPSNDMNGAPAEDVFTFRANRTGQTTLTFVYDRPWNNNSPTRTFTLDVDVYKNAQSMAQADGEWLMGN